MDLPNEIVTYILNMVPEYYIIVCKHVCKLWYAIMKDRMSRTKITIHIDKKLKCITSNSNLDNGSIVQKIAKRGYHKILEWMHLKNLIPVESKVKIGFIAYKYHYQKMINFVQKYNYPSNQFLEGAVQCTKDNDDLIISMMAKLSSPQSNFMFWHNAISSIKNCNKIKTLQYLVNRFGETIITKDLYSYAGMSVEMLTQFQKYLLLNQKKLNQFKKFGCRNPKVMEFMESSGLINKHDLINQMWIDISVADMSKISEYGTELLFWLKQNDPCFNHKFLDIVLNRLSTHGLCCIINKLDEDHINDIIDTLDLIEDKDRYQKIICYMMFTLFSFGDQIGAVYYLGTKLGIDLHGYGIYKYMFEKGGIELINNCFYGTYDIKIIYDLVSFMYDHGRLLNNSDLYKISDSSECTKENRFYFELIYQLAAKHFVFNTSNFGLMYYNIQDLEKCGPIVREMIPKMRDALDILQDEDDETDLYDFAEIIAKYNDMENLEYFFEVYPNCGNGNVVSREITNKICIKLLLNHGFCLKPISLKEALQTNNLGNYYSAMNEAITVGNVAYVECCFEEKMIPASFMFNTLAKTQKSELMWCFLRYGFNWLRFDDGRNAIIKETLKQDNLVLLQWLCQKGCRIELELFENAKLSSTSQIYQWFRINRHYLLE